MDQIKDAFRGAKAKLDSVMFGDTNGTRDHTSSANQTEEDITSQAKVAFETVKVLFDSTVEGLSDLQWEQLPQVVIDHIKANPGTSAYQFCIVLIVFNPTLVATPTLYTLGFGAQGPIAGSLAAGFQSAMGPALPFPILQSAAMGGYGAPIVHGFVRGGALTSAGLAEALKYAGDALPPDASFSDVQDYFTCMGIQMGSAGIQYLAKGSTGMATTSLSVPLSMLGGLVTPSAAILGLDGMLRLLAPGLSLVGSHSVCMKTLDQPWEPWRPRPTLYCNTTGVCQLRPDSG